MTWSHVASVRFALVCRRPRCLMGATSTSVISAHIPSIVAKGTRETFQAVLDLAVLQVAKRAELLATSDGEHLYANRGFARTSSIAMRASR